MKTKEKILENARVLYNKNGLNNVTTRDIAKYMNISAGNLHYHFKHTNDIILELFHEFESAFDALILKFQNRKLKTLNVLDQFIKDSVILIHRYKFILIGFQSIISNIPIIRETYVAINIRRKSEFATIFDNLIRLKIFRNDIPEEQLAMLVSHIFIVGDFWIAYNDASFQTTEIEAIERQYKLLKGLFYPYLSTHGIKLWNKRERI